MEGGASAEEGALKRAARGKCVGASLYPMLPVAFAAEEFWILKRRKSMEAEVVDFGSAGGGAA
eukprot:scaffold12612_cov36-Tisochrysis_lutea.AAC.4